MRKRRGSMLRDAARRIAARMLTLCLVAALSTGCGSYKGTISGVLGTPAEDVPVNLRQYKLTERGNNRVYHTDESRPLADRVLRVVEKQETYLEKALGLRAPDKFAVVIVKPRAGKVRYHVVSPRGWSVWTFAPEDPAALSTPGEFEHVYHTLLHERTENAVTHALHEKDGLYGANPQTRWIGDGLAEWVAYRYSKEASPIAAAAFMAHRRESLNTCRDTWNVRHIDLREFRAWVGSPGDVKAQVASFIRYPDVMAADYAMSCCFWASVEKEKGVEGVRGIVTRLRSLQQPSNENVDKAVAEVLGPAFVQRIRESDTAEGLAFIEGEIRTLIPRLREGLKSDDYGVRNASRLALARLDEQTFKAELAGMPTTARVTDVIPESPAYRAGLRAGMIVDSVDGESVEEFDKFVSRLRQPRTGVTSVSVFERDGKRLLKVDSFSGSRFERVPR